MQHRWLLPDGLWALLWLVLYGSPTASVMSALHQEYWQNVTLQGRRLPYTLTPRPAEQCQTFVSSVPDVEGLGHAQANRNFGLMLAASLWDAGVCYAYAPLNRHAGKAAVTQKARTLGRWEQFLGKPAAWPELLEVLRTHPPIKLHAKGHTALLRHHHLLQSTRERQRTYLFVQSDTFDHCPTAAWWADAYLRRRAAAGRVKRLLDPPQPRVLQVALHLRRFDVTTIASRSRRIHQDSFFQRVLEQLRTLIPASWEVTVHIMTSSLFSHQAPVLRRSVGLSYPNATLHLNDADTDTFHAFVTADVLVLDRSRFSHLAGLWSAGIKLSSPFRYATNCDASWVAVSEGGRVDASAFRSAWALWRQRTRRDEHRTE
eukprot:EG_transcript_14778